jgi:hypothetical protein
VNQSSFSSQLLLIAAIGLWIFVSACRLNPIEGLQWDTDVLAPVAYSRVNAFDALSDSGYVETDGDNLIYLAIRDTIASENLADYIEFPDTFLNIGISLDTLQLDSDTISQSITLQEVAEQLSAEGNFIGDILLASDGQSIGFVPGIPGLGSGPLAVDASDFFEFAELESGQMVLTITNEFPVALDSVIFEIRNTTNPDPAIIADTFYFIPSGSFVTETYDLAGKQIESSLVAELVNLNTVAAGSTLVDLNDYIEISLVAENLRAKTATAIFPNQDFLDTIRTTAYNFGSEFGEVELTKLVVESGRIVAESKSTVEDTILFSYRLPAATNRAGEIPGVSIKLDPAPVGGISTETNEANLEGFVVDLTAGGQGFNLLQEQITVSMLSSGQLITLDQSDSVTVSFGLVDIVPTYVEGYIGTYSFTFEGREALDFFENLNVEKIRFAQARAEIIFSNSVGVDAQLIVKEFTAHQRASNTSVKLTGTPLVAGPFFIAGANLPDTNLAAQTPLSFEPDNSNIVNFINVLPDEISYDLEVVANHNGKPGVWDNFATSNSQISAILDFQLPLDGVIGGLVLVDSVELNLAEFPDLSTISEGTLRLILENRFPVEVQVSAIIYDENWDEVFRLSDDASLAPGLPNDQGYVESATQSVIETAVTVGEVEKIFEEGKRLVFRFRVDTRPDGEDVKIYADYDIVSRLVSEFRFRVETE